MNFDAKPRHRSRSPLRRQRPQNPIPLSRSAPTAPHCMPSPLFPNLALLSRNPNFPILSLLTMPRAPPPPPEVVSEYAKSGRSSCKGCGSSIAVGVLRVGLSTKDPRGWDAVKWHHIACFPRQPLGAADQIKGFPDLKESDQEALKKLEAENADLPVPELSQPAKVTKSIEKVVSVSAVKDKFKVIVEYAKSNRSSCKGCGEVLTAGSPRLGLSNKDTRGFDFVKWYHLTCFPVGTMALGSAEEIDGFSLLKDCDKDTITKLEAAVPANQSNKEVVPRLSEKSDERILKKPKLSTLDDVGSERSMDQNSEEQKLSEPGKVGGLEMDFSVSNIKDMYKEAKLPPKWKAFKTIIFCERDDNLHDSEKIAAFDFDGCLANTSVKKTGPDAWSLMYPSIPQKLQELYNSGYKLVIFTNESNIERWKNKRQQAIDSKIGRLNKFINVVKVPIQVFIACGLGKSKDLTEDPFRKPKTGMWRLMEKHFNSDITIDMEQSFYVGDAAGRANDHSDADIKFAQDIGLKFHAPEEFFGLLDDGK